MTVSATSPRERQRVPGTGHRRRLSWWVGNVAVPLTFVVLLAVFVWSRRSDLAPIWQDPDGGLVAIAALALVSQLLNATEFWVLYRRTSVALGIVENAMLFAAGQLGNLLPAQMGAVYKFRYMKAVHDIGYARSGSVYGANVVISFVSASVTGLVGVVGFTLAGGRFSLVMLLVWLGLAFLASFLLAMPVPRVARIPRRFSAAWASFHEAWEQLRRDPGTLAVTGVLDVARLLITALRFQIAFSLLGVEESYWFFAAIAAAGAISGTIGFTPGSVGFRETFITGTAVAMGTTIDLGLLAATVDRAVLLAISAVMGSVGFAVTYPRLRRARARDRSSTPHGPERGSRASQPLDRPGPAHRTPEASGGG